MHNRICMMVALWACALLISGCGALEIGIEHVSPGTGGEAINWQATAEALQTEATRVSSEGAAPRALMLAETISSPLPTVVPAAASPSQQAVVAYVQGGDIWVKPLPNGEAQRLTHDGRNQSPRWSASGEWLAFQKGTDFPQLWIMRRDGSDAGQLGNMIGESHAWSPVSDMIAFGDTGGINLLMPETGEQTVFSSHIDSSMPPTTTSHIGTIVWSPDGQQLAFTTMEQPVEEGIANDALWLVDVEEGSPVKLLEGSMPEQGEIILHGWSGDGQYLLYWQAPILSAAILADGVPLYALPVDGGEPIEIAEIVLVQDDAVQAQPTGEQIAVVTGGGRAVWTGKILHLVSPDDTQGVQLSLEDQSAAFPVWSPDGARLAYVGMPDATNQVVGGPEAQAALAQRQLWLVEIDDPEPRAVTDESDYRDEAPQWVDSDTLLFARLDQDGRASLWTVGVDGAEAQQVVDEITPAPEWFGFYGYIDWSLLFDVWHPVATEASTGSSMLEPTAVPMSASDNDSLALTDVLDQMHPDLTSEEAVRLWGEPDEVLGDGMVLYQYELQDGPTIWFAFRETGPLLYAQLVTDSGRRFELVPLDEGEELMPARPPMTPTSTPASMETATATPLATIVPPGTSTGQAGETPTPYAPAATTELMPTVEPSATAIL